MDNVDEYYAFAEVAMTVLLGVCILVIQIRWYWILILVLSTPKMSELEFFSVCLELAS